MTEILSEQELTGTSVDACTIWVKSLYYKVLTYCADSILVTMPNN
ncbi:hypothetical protein [Mannheimia pernigra]|nr:hypothetical protein [Mannheimia pernigra]AGK01110.1 hypothetical protein MHH_c06400 [Mannheimia haemolytica M42548]